MDMVWFARYKRDGGEQGLLAWEFGADVKSWADVSAPGQLGKRVVEGFLQHELPERWARFTNNAVHWITGVAWGAQFGIVAGSTKRPKARWGLVLGPVVWLSGYAVLPFADLYKPIWEYDARTLAKDLSAHVVYGATTTAVFAALARGE